MKHLNAIVIAVSVLLASLLIIWRMPRYQYFRIQHRSTDKDGDTTYDTDSYVFDMVTGKLHTHASFQFISPDGKFIKGTHFNHENPSIGYLILGINNAKYLGKNVRLMNGNGGRRSVNGNANASVEAICASAHCRRLSRLSAASFRSMSSLADVTTISKCHNLCEY